MSSSKERHYLLLVFKDSDSYGNCEEEPDVRKMGVGLENEWQELEGRVLDQR
jgi:hypothetical protein